MADHRITRSVVQEDASFVLDCSCGLRFFGKDRAEVMKEWRRRCDPLKAVK
jgi:hypothetical protein